MAFGLPKEHIYDKGEASGIIGILIGYKISWPQASEKGFSTWN